MSRRKAGCIPRRVELEPVAAAGSDNDDDDMELVIEVEPEPDARFPKTQGQRWKEVAAPPGCSDREPRFCLDASVHALGSRPKCWAALMEDRPAGELQCKSAGVAPTLGHLHPCVPVPPSPFPASPSWGAPPTFSSSPPALTTTLFLPADRPACPEKHPDLLTCGRCLQAFPLEAITTFMDHKKLGCQLSRGPSFCQRSGE